MQSGGSPDQSQIRASQGKRPASVAVPVLLRLLVGKQGQTVGHGEQGSEQGGGRAGGEPDYQAKKIN
jgi:hypothetical protein